MGPHKNKNLLSLHCGCKSNKFCGFAKIFFLFFVDMPQFKNITTLIFDFGGVLINLDRERCIKSFNELGILNTNEILGNFGQKGVFLQLEKGLISASDFRDELRKQTSQTLTDEEIDNAWSAFLLDVPKEKIQLLEQLRTKFRVLLLSNTNEIHINIFSKCHATETGKQLDDYFDKCYLSYKIHLVKPDVEIFEYVLNDAELKPEECLFLDDGQKNIEVAKTLAIQTYLVQANENLNFLLDDNTWL